MLVVIGVIDGCILVTSWLVGLLVWKKEMVPMHCKGMMRVGELVTMAWEVEVR